MPSSQNRPVEFDPVTWIVTDKGGHPHEVHPQAYWYLAPSRTSWSPEDGIVDPMKFGMTLHNASLGEGLVVSLDQLLSGIAPSHAKKGQAGAAEDLFENVRVNFYPHRPSRLRCYFLSLSRSAAEERALNWDWSDRVITPCHVVRSGAKFHYADVREFELCAKRELDEQYAHNYWKDIDPETPSDVVELLADSSIYFPDWRTFARIDFRSAAMSERYRTAAEKCAKANGE